MRRVQTRRSYTVVREEDLRQLHNLDVDGRKVDALFFGNEELLALSRRNLFEASKRQGQPSHHGNILVERPALVAKLVLAAGELHLTSGAICATEEGDHVREQLTAACAVNGNELERLRSNSLFNSFLKTSAK